MNIVIADDSLVFREKIKDLVMLNKDVTIVGEARNGIEAIQLVREKKPDLLILDIQMPEMNGIKVLEALKGNVRTTKICVFTNYPYPQYKKRCMNEGADYFFDKNVDFLEVKKLLAQLAGK
jgi:DNA-binding NarL/FixJ family response regulator